MTAAPAIGTRFWPKSICIWSPGAVSTRTVASSATRCAARMSATARWTVRTLTVQPPRGQQPLHHDRIARRPARRTASAPRRDVVGQPPRRGPHLPPGLDRLPQISPDRIARDAHLARNRLVPDAAIRQRRESR